MKPQPDCPECEKLANVSEESNKIGDFITWLHKNDMDIVAYDANGYLKDYPEYIGYSGIQKLLAQYFEIDLDKVEAERRELLRWIQDVQTGDEE